MGGEPSYSGAVGEEGGRIEVDLVQELSPEEGLLSVGAESEEALEGRSEEGVEGRAGGGVQTEGVESGDESNPPQPEH